MNNRKLKQQAADAYLAAIPLITLNFVWFLLSLPLVTLFPATGGLFYATHRLARGHDANWRTLIEGFRLYWRQSVVWGLLNLFFAVIVASNLIYYTLHPADWTTVARAVVIVFALLWLAVQMHAFPLLFEQEQPRLTQAIRNGAVILLQRPLRTVGVALLIALIAALSTLIIQPAWIFFSAGACTYLANRSTIGAIAALPGKPVEEPGAESRDPSENEG